MAKFRFRLLATLSLVAGCVVACASGDDTAGMNLLRSEVPQSQTGEPYLSVDVGGACTTDCPPAAISRGRVIPCADLAAARTGYEALLDTAGFEPAGDDAWTKTADNRKVTVTVLTYDDASTGPQPTEQPYVDAPGNLSGACSLVVVAAVLPE